MDNKIFYEISNLAENVVSIPYEKRLNMNLKDIFNYYELNDMDIIYNNINIIIKKIKNSYINEVLEYSKEIKTKINNQDYINYLYLLSPKIDVNEIMEKEVYNLLSTLRRMQEDRRYEGLYENVKKEIEKVSEQMQEGFNDNSRKIVEKVQGELNLINNKTSNVELEKSENPFPFEIMGINLDDRKNIMWTQIENKNYPLNQVTSPNKNVAVYKISDNCYVQINKTAEDKINAVFYENDKVIKTTTVTKNDITYINQNGYVKEDYKTGTLLYKNQNGEYSYDLNNISSEDLDKLKANLNSMDPNIIGYYKRKSPEVFNMNLKKVVDLLK